GQSLGTSEQHTQCAGTQHGPDGYLSVCADPWKFAEDVPGCECDWPLTRRQHQPETNKVTTRTWISCTTRCRAGIVDFVGKSSPTNYPESIFVDSVAVIGFSIRIVLVWTAGPFPDVAAHVGKTIYTTGAGYCANSTR